MNSKLKPQGLAIIGNTYMVAMFMPEGLNMQVIVSFRDMTPLDGIRNFSLDSAPAGPWSKVKNGMPVVEVADEHKDIFTEISKEVFDMLNALNHRPIGDLIKEWRAAGGTSYIYEQ